MLAWIAITLSEKVSLTRPQSEVVRVDVPCLHLQRFFEALDSCESSVHLRINTTKAVSMPQGPANHVLKETSADQKTDQTIRIFGYVISRDVLCSEWFYVRKLLYGL